MKRTLTARLRLWSGLLVAAFALALPGALASSADAYYRPELDTGLYIPDDPGFDGPTYQPGGPAPPAPAPAADPAPSTPAPAPAPAPDASGGASGPAAADPGGDAFATDGDSGFIETPAEPTDGDGDAAARAARYAEDTNNALDLVQLKLRDQHCAYLVDGRNGSARDVLQQLIARQRNNPGIVDRGDVRFVNPTTGREVFAQAPVGAGGNGTITLYRLFHNPPSSPNSLFGTGGGAFMRSLDPLPYGIIGPDPTLGAAEARAVVILHELAHLTGALDHGDEGATAFNRKLLSDCLRGLGKDPIPTPLPAPRQGTGGSGDDGGGFLELPSTPSEPLPESDDPQIPVADAPVLVLPDGRRIDEGEIGEAPDDDPGYGGDDGPYCGDYCGDDGGYDDGGYDDGGYGGGGGGGGWDDGDWDWGDGGWGGEDVPEAEAPNES
jgi:hypothetical protein